MPFDPREFLKLARCFAGPGLGEAEYRTAICRTLYGLFLWARAELEARGEDVRIFGDHRGGEHGRVRARFKQGRFRRDNVWHRLGSLYDLRNNSDYDLDVPVGRDQVREALELADYIETIFLTDVFATPP